MKAIVQLFDIKTSLHYIQFTYFTMVKDLLPKRGVASVMWTWLLYKRSTSQGKTLEVQDCNYKIQANKHQVEYEDKNGRSCMFQ